MTYDFSFEPTRSVNTSFWANAKENELSNEEKLIYLYALTNESSRKPHYLHPDIGYTVSYKFNINFASRQLGYTKEALEGLLERMTQEDKSLEYNKETKEITLYPL